MDNIRWKENEELVEKGDALEILAWCFYVLSFEHRKD